jgi:hypothetical protein
LKRLLDGKIESAGITLLGYEKGECYQGMYGKTGN